MKNALAIKTIKYQHTRTPDTQNTGQKGECLRCCENGDKFPWIVIISANYLPPKKPHNYEVSVAIS